MTEEQIRIALSRHRTSDPDVAGKLRAAESVVLAAALAARDLVAAPDGHEFERGFERMEEGWRWYAEEITRPEMTELGNRHDYP